MLSKVAIRKRIEIEKWAQCLGCRYGETLPFGQGRLDGQDIGGEIYYGKFRQDTDGNIYHNCGHKLHPRKCEWHICQLFPGFRQSNS